MARKLKTFKTSIGFYDLAIAASSMKAATEAWGTDPDIFRKGHAVQTDDPTIVKATTSAPGVVFRRPVGSDGKFVENAALPEAPTYGGSKRDEPDHEEKQREQRQREQVKKKAEAVLAHARKRHESELRRLKERRDEIAKAELREKERWDEDQQKYRDALEESKP